MMNRQFLFCLVLLTIPALTVQMCPDGFEEVDGRCFCASTTERTFEMAMYDCMYKAPGSSLVVIDDAEDREDAMFGLSGPVPYWINPNSLDVDFNTPPDVENCYICEAPQCPPTTPLPTVFDYGAAVSAYDNLEATLGPEISAELGMGSFRQDLDLYAGYDGNQLANLPNISGIIIQPERWAVCYASGEGVITGLFLPETRNFDPNVGLPVELPSSAVAVVRDNYPLFFNRYLSNLETDYANSRDDVDFDEVTYGPDANCPYPPRTELGGGFDLDRIPPALCFPIIEREVVDPDPAARAMIVIVTIEVVGDTIWIEILVFRTR
ncbi:PREDICTED: uncharacterized protein LOC109482915 [Branchiostoma belcheri]|uniref:Uncharacterized protein LOC109482915 n=1 Tax=Branchiostoma belcheri TaxID=7741 RepID=A0A6P4ZWT6_BRABE|nr:PREDICTED: uncharacterized protein LOC109482915 [Branchiostoma belcheri]